MDREQAVFPALCAVHPREGALDPEAGLVEPRHLRISDLIAHRFGELVKLPGQPRGHGGDGTRSHRRPKHDAHNLRDPGLGQELPVPKPDREPRDPGAVLHGSADPERGRAPW
jgi:hypothetical protein